MFANQGFALNTISIGRSSAIRRLVKKNEVIFLVPSRVDSPPKRVAEWLRKHLRTGHLRYIRDPRWADVWQSPARTLSRGGGDCEDFAILVAALLGCMGVRCEVVVGLHNGVGHAWVEGTYRGCGFLIEGTTGDLHYQRPWAYQVTERYQAA